MLKIQLWTAVTRAMASRKLEALNIMNTYISSTWHTAIFDSARCMFPMIIRRGLLTVRVN